MRNGSRPGKNGGITYFGVLILVTLIGLSLALAAQELASAIRRDHEQQLLWVGHAYRNAVEHYFRKHGRYPRTLEDLRNDPGGTPPDHYLRKLYPDPMTGDTNWTLQKGPDGGIMGVSSTATGTPFKVARFDDEDVDFDKATTYADWHFVFDPNARTKQYGQSVFGTPGRQ